MKRLIKKADGNITLYHLTDYEGAMGVVKDRVLVPNKQKGAGKPGNHFEYELKRAIENNELEKAEKLKKHIENIDDNFYGYVFLTNDYKGKFFQYGGGIVFEVSVPTDKLEPDNNDCYDCETWQESLAKTQQCKIKGEIAEDQIIKIHICNNERTKRIETNLDNFEEDYKNFNKKEMMDIDTPKDNSWINQLSVDEKLQLIEKSDGRALRYIDNFDKDFLLELINQNFRYVEFINDEEAQKMAIDINPEAIYFIDYPSIEVQKHCIDKNLAGYLRDIDDSLLKYALTQLDANTMINLCNRGKLSDEDIVEAIKHNKYLFYNLISEKIYLSDYVYIEALKTFGDAKEAIDWIKEQHESDSKIQMPNEAVLREITSKLIGVSRLLKSGKIELEEILKRLRNGEEIGFHEQSRTINFQELRNTINEEESKLKTMKNEEEKRKKQQAIKEVRKYLINQYREVKEGIQIFDETNNPIKHKTKTMTIFSGPSGSGKSTITQILKHQIGKIIDVDELSRLDGLDFYESRERASQLIEQYIQRGISFSIENTLRNDGIFKNIKKARENGYQIIVYYVGLMDVELNLERIKERVLHEGNEVPTDVVLNIYKESLSRMKQLVETADQSVIIDNSGTQPVAVARFKDGNMVGNIKGEYVEWVEESLNI